MRQSFSIEKSDIFVICSSSRCNYAFIWGTPIQTFDCSFMLLKFDQLEPYSAVENYKFIIITSRSYKRTNIIPL